MSTYIRIPQPGGSGSGIATYSTFAAFPPTAADGAAAIALDTDTLYIFNTGTMTWSPVASPGTLLSIGTINSQTKSANGAVDYRTQLVMQTADTSFPGLVSTGTQSFAGNKTFTGTIGASNLSGTNTGDVTLGTANGLSLSGQALSLALFTSSTPGAVSASGGGTTNFLRADGTWAVPSGGGGGSGFNYLNSNLSVYGGTNSTLSFVGVENTVVGIGSGAALSASSGGSHNTFYGYQAGAHVTTGGDNVIVGTTADVSSGNTGSQSVLIGSGVSAGAGPGSTGGMVLIGYGVGGFNQGDIIIGQSASGSSAASGSSIIIGEASGTYSSSSVQNVALGTETLTALTSGSYNSLLGVQAGQVITSGSNNVLLGYQSGQAITTGGNNTLVGYQAGNSLVSGSGNTVLGYGISLSSGTANSTGIGNGAAITASNQVVLGNTSVTSTVLNGTLTLNSYGAGILLSSSSGVVSTSAGTSGYLLTSNGAGVAPTFQQINLGTSAAITGTLGVGNGGLGATSFTNYAPIIYNGTNFVSAATGLSNSGYILTSNGSGSAPTWQAAPGTGTVTSVAMTVPSFLSISGSPITTSGTLAVSLSGTALPIANGGTGVTSVTTSPTASAFAGWDANKNLSANNFLAGYTTTTQSASLVTLTVSSTQQQFFTGSLGQNVKMPVTSTLVLGQSWIITNNGTGNVNVYSSDNVHIIVTVNPGMTAVVTCISLSGTDNTSWSYTNTFQTPLTVLNGGTGASDRATAFDNLSPTTLRGDTIYHGATHNNRLAIGTNGQVLTSNGTDPTWANPTGISEAQVWARVAYGM